MAHFDSYSSQKSAINEDLLHKADPDIQDLLSRIRSGQAKPEDADRIERHLYQDTLVPGLRNKAAYHEHQKDYDNSGTHVAIDLNSLGKINKLHTEIAGDKAIKDLGEVLHRTSAKYGGRAFRNGGDEFSAHFMEPEHAHRFARDFEKEMDDYHKVHGPVGGTHRLGAAVGIGHNREHAGKALIEAKKKLYDQNEFGDRTPKFDYREMPSAIHSLAHEPTPLGWKTAKEAIATKKKNSKSGQNIQVKSDHPAAAPSTLHFPGTMSVAGAHPSDIHYTSTPAAYKYVQTPMSNPLTKSDSPNPGYSEVHPDVFEAAIRKQKNIGALSENRDYAGKRTFLSPSGTSGYTLKANGELNHVFSTVPGEGVHAMHHAISNGASHLDTFDGRLPSYYSQFGFKEVRREPNWTPGGPDVVFMAKSEKEELEHPAISGDSPVGMITAENPHYPVKTPGGMVALVKELQAKKIPHEITVGKYGSPEASIITHGLSLKQLGDIGYRYGQGSVVYSHGGQNALLFTNGPQKDHWHPGNGKTVKNSVPDDDYTVVHSKGKNRYLTYKFDTDTLLPLRMHGPGKHPHAYQWHEAHTQHNDSKLEKAETGNSQAPGRHSETYPDIAQHFGSITPGAKTNLQHYDYRSFEPQIEALAAKHGYKFKLFGGKYPPMDLGKENYNTGHIGVYDPSPGSGGNTGDEDYTRSWRKMHELSHALTYKDLNDKYGEGRRIGKLGYHRTPNEAKRAVEWEDMAVEKQRQLGEQIGHHIPDPIYNQERNSVLADAVHRAIHGTFIEPSEEGFSPSVNHVPIEHALGLIDQHATSMGLGPDETLRSKAKAVVKSELIKGAMQRLA